MDRERQDMIRKGLQPVIVTDTLQFRTNDTIPVGSPVILKPNWNGEPTVHIYRRYGILRRFFNWVLSCKQTRVETDTIFGVIDNDADQGDIVGVRVCGRFSLN